MNSVDFASRKKVIGALFGSPAFHIFFIVVATVIVYSHTFHYPFAFDDGLYISRNNTLSDYRYFLDPAAGRDIADPLHYYALKMRYVGTLTFAVNYHLGGLDVTGYRAVNVFIHLVNAVLVYWLVTLTFGTPFFLSRTTLTRARHIAFFSSLLFAIHPIETQAVTYITQRFTSLTAMFYLSSLVLYIRWRNESLIPDKEHARRRRKVKAISLYLGSLLSAVLAMKTKEIAFTLPFIIALYEGLFFGGKFNNDGLRGYSNGWKSGLSGAMPLIPFILTLLIIPAGLVEINRPTGDVISDIDGATRLQSAIPRTAYLFTEFRVIITYLRLLFLPINQNLDYDFPIYTTFSDSRVWLSFLCLFSIFSLAVYLFYRSRSTSGPLISNLDRSANTMSYPTTADVNTSSLRLISFGLLWFFITLLVESSVMPIADVIFEHRLYLPSIGISLAFVSAIFYITDIGSLYYPSSTSQKAVIAGTFLLVAAIVLSFAAYQRNTVWKDAIGLWEDVAKKSPQKARAHNNLGHYYMVEGQFDKAIAELQNALRLDPAFHQARENLVMTYINSERWEEARKEALSLTYLLPTKTEPLAELGIIYLNMNMPDEAIGYLQRAITLGPRYDPAFVILGLAYFDKGWNDRAMEVFNQAININPNNPDAYYDRGLLFFNLNDFDLARKDYKMACSLGHKKGCDAGTTMDK